MVIILNNHHDYEYKSDILICYQSLYFNKKINFLQIKQFTVISPPDVRTLEKKKKKKLMSNIQNSRNLKYTYNVLGRYVFLIRGDGFLHYQ